MESPQYRMWFSDSGKKRVSTCTGSFTEVEKDERYYKSVIKNTISSIERPRVKGVKGVRDRKKFANVIKTVLRSDWEERYSRTGENSNEKSRCIFTSKYLRKYGKNVNFRRDNKFRVNKI